MKRFRLVWLILVAGCGAEPPQPAVVDGRPAYDAESLRDPFVPAGRTQVIGTVISGAQRWAVVRNPALQEQVVSVGTRLPFGRIRDIDSRGIIVDVDDGSQRRLALVDPDQEGQR